MTVGEKSLQYSGGAYYDRRENGYAVVKAPVGSTLRNLPAGATVTTINGLRYYEVGGVYYRPVYENGALVYKVVVP